MALAGRGLRIWRSGLEVVGLWGVLPCHVSSLSGEGNAAISPRGGRWTESPRTGAENPRQRSQKLPRRRERGVSAGRGAGVAAWCIVRSREHIVASLLLAACGRRPRPYCCMVGRRPCGASSEIGAFAFPRTTQHKRDSTKGLPPFLHHADEKPGKFQRIPPLTFRYI